MNPADIGKIKKPTAEELEEEGWEGNDQVRENNWNWKGGLRTDDLKEYDRQRHKKNYVSKGPRRSYKGKNNPNYKNGDYVI